METLFAPSSLRKPFMHDFQSFYSDLVRGCIEARPGPLGWPSIDKIPAKFLFAVFVHQNDRAVLALGFSIDGLLAPIPEGMIFDNPPLQSDVRILDQAR